MGTESGGQQVRERADYIARSPDRQQDAQYLGEERRPHNQVSDRSDLKSEMHHGYGEALPLAVIEGVAGAAGHTHKTAKGGKECDALVDRLEQLVEQSGHADITHTGEEIGDQRATRLCGPDGEGDHTGRNDQQPQPTGDSSRATRFGHRASNGATPLMRSQNPSGISYAAMGNHMSCVTAPCSNPPSCSGRPTTIKIEATTPSHASGTGIIRPRSSSQEKSVLPRAKKLAATSGLSSSTNPASVCADAGSGALVASQSSPSDAGMETAPVTPSATRQVSPSIARSASWSRVIAHRLTASASAQKLLNRERTAATCTSVACWATEASFAAIPSPLVARLIRTMLGNATAM